MNPFSIHSKVSTYAEQTGVTPPTVADIAGDVLGVGTKMPGKEDESASKASKAN